MENVPPRPSGGQSGLATVGAPAADVCRSPARAAAGSGVVVVLHDLRLAAADSDRVASLGGGEIIACGRPDDVLAAGLLSEVYRYPVEVIRRPETGAFTRSQPR